MVYILSVLVAISVFEAAWGSDIRANNVGVIGGRTISIEEAPFMASLFSNGRAYCAGTIVHERFILTAAYCLLGNSGSNWKVLVGADRRDENGVFIDVDNVYKYHPHELIENVCLLRLKKPVPLSARVARVELSDDDLIISEGTMLNVTGWGRTMIHDDKPNELHQATIPVVRNKYCMSLRKTLLCAGSASQGACYGDTGGALTHNNIQIGVVSMVTPDCVQPAIFARVSTYADWIKTTINDNQ